MWKDFGVVTDCENGDLDFTACKKCYHAFSYKGRSTSTATMAKHKCKVSSGQSLLAPIAKPKKHAPSTSKKDAMLAAAQYFICRDVRPFDTVAGVGFKHIIQEVSLFKLL